MIRFFPAVIESEILSFSPQFVQNKISRHINNEVPSSDFEDLFRDLAVGEVLSLSSILWRYGHLAEDPWVQENLNDVRTLARFIQDYGDAYTTLNFISNLDENYYQRFHQDEQIFKLAMVNLDVSCEEQRLLTCRKKFVDAEFGGYGERFLRNTRKT